jgi:hypothetical protein
VTGLARPRHDRPVRSLVEELAAGRIGSTYNQYADSALRRERLARYLEARADAPLLLVGEAAGYRGARVSGLPFTSERQLTGEGPAEASATIVHRVLDELGLTERVLLWNVVPTHPGTETTIAVGRLAAAVTHAPYVRHPSHGGAAAFRAGLLSFAAGAREVRRFSV